MYLLLCGSDLAKYGTLVKGIATQYSLMGEKGKPNGQYPKSLAHATDALSNYSFGSKYHKKKHKRCQDKTKCCKQDKDDNEKKNFAQKDKFFCYCCGDKKTYPSTKFPEKDMRPKEEWVINKAKQYVQDADNNEEEEEYEDQKPTTKGK